jgi:hypothetical protein
MREAWPDYTRYISEGSTGQVRATAQAYIIEALRGPRCRLREEQGAEGSPRDEAEGWWVRATRTSGPVRLKPNFEPRNL